MADDRLSPRAERDLEDIWLHTESRWSAAQAEREVNALIDAIEERAADPSTGRSADDIRPGYRKRAAGSPLIFHRMGGLDIEAIRIPHRRMDLPARLRE